MSWLLLFFKVIRLAHSSVSVLRVYLSCEFVLGTLSHGHHGNYTAHAVDEHRSMNWKLGTRYWTSCARTQAVLKESGLNRRDNC
jgi:hypothetical protein